MLRTRCHYLDDTKRNFYSSNSLACGAVSILSALWRDLNGALLARFSFKNEKFQAGDVAQLVKAVENLQSQHLGGGRRILSSGSSCAADDPALKKRKFK